MIPLILKLVVSVLTPVVLAWGGVPATLVERILLAVGTFLAWSVFELLRDVRSLRDARSREEEHWLITNDFETELVNLRRDYGRIAQSFYGRNDLFRDHIQTLVCDVAAVVRRAADKKELAVRDYHFRSRDLVLDALEGDPEKAIRYVWVLDEPFVDEMWRHYLAQVDELVHQKKVKHVRALLVVTDKSILEREEVRLICGFYAHNQAYDYRIVEAASFAHLSKDDNLDHTYIDFGIYGQRYLYLTISYGDQTRGVFTKDSGVITRYKDFFDRLWRSGTVSQLEKAKLPKVGVADVCAIGGS